ncbi:MFS general substrate transporter [Phanerochaete sordida]|uniref:MFS general substrate transporter n=1 Tax=Phanerochaete sordida TaxID=48140 RepID=A0A9P3GPK6_9APHY|nr:MFS general substrate transporter [Phanerochaete sordida]
MPGSKSRDACIIAIVCCVTVLSVFTSGATSVAITTIGRDLGFSQEDLQWPVNVYSLSYGCLLLLCGRMADIWGSKRMFLAGSAWFSVWSIAAAFAKNPPTFIIFAGLQGIGSAANTPSGISIISSYFETGKKKNTAFAVLSAGQSIGFIIGMILGGVLSQSTASWRTIFWLQAGLAAALCVGGWFVLPDDDVSQRYSMGLDWVGAILGTTGIGMLVSDLAESTVTPKGWATPFVPSLLGTSVLLLVSFVLWELRREARGQSVLLPMSMWTQPGAKMVPVMLFMFFGWWGFNTLGYYVPLFFQQVQGLTPLQTAVRLVPMGCSGLISNILAGYLVGVIRGQVLVVASLLSGLASCLVFALIDVHASYWAMALPAVLLLPVLDVAYTVANIQVCSSFPAHSQALAGSIFNVATRLGTSIGLAVTSTLAASVSARFARAHPPLAPDAPDVLMAGFRAAGWLCCGACALAVLISAVGMRGVGFVGQSAPVVEKPASGDVELARVSLSGGAGGENAGSVRGEAPTRESKEDVVRAQEV